jgi:hypothetical protein
VRRKAALQQATETLEDLDQVRRCVKRLEKHLEIPRISFGGPSAWVEHSLVLELLL